jgi:hypothetical protein
MSHRTREAASPRLNGLSPGAHRLLCIADAAVADANRPTLVIPPPITGA